MELKNELIKLRGYMDSGDETNAQKLIEFINKNFTTEEEQKEIRSFISSKLKELTEYTNSVINEIGIKVQLMEVAQIVSMSYIATNYFQKTRQWLYKKINGSLVNGKPAKFTNEEIKTLNYALKDISSKIGSIAIS